VSAITPALRFRHERYETVGSTNDLARAAALRGEPEGLWVLAGRQTAGRGRHGRNWESPLGNFFGSLLLRPRRPPRELASLSLVTALAVAEAVDRLSLGTLRAGVKWPNDVLLDGAKLAGILLESGTTELEPDPFLIVGVGVNLAHHPSGTPYPTISLAARGVGDVTPDRFLGELEPVLGRLYALWRTDGFAAIRTDWLARAVGLGAEIGLRTGTAERRGTFVDLGTDGTLRLADASGRIDSVSAGELFFPATP